MPTTGERRALIFIASVAALGVAVRGWREAHPADPGALAGNRAELARQIQAVDSAIGVTSSRRKDRTRAKPRSGGGTPDPGAERAPSVEASPRPSTRRVRQSPRPDSTRRDPRQAYWDRSEYFDSVRRSLARAEQSELKHGRSQNNATVSKEYQNSTVGSAPLDLDVADLDEIAALRLIGPSLARRIYVDRAENGPFGSIAELERVSGITHAFARRLERFVTFSGTPRHGSTGERRPQAKKERRPGNESRP